MGVSVKRWLDRRILGGRVTSGEPSVGGVVASGLWLAGNGIDG